MSNNYSDPVWVYLEKLKKVNLMSQDEVVKCASMMKFAQHHIEAIKALKEPEESAEYWQKMYNKAKEALIIANMRLVVSIAKRFLGRGIEIADLIQEGNRGLMTAVENFKYELGNKFSTYAIWWIRQAMFRVVHEKSKTIHIPSITFDLSLKAEKSANKYYLKHGRWPSTEELAMLLKIPVDKMKLVLESCLTVLSFDKSLGGENDEGFTLEDVVPDKHIKEDPLVKLSIMDLHRQINEALSTLEDKERLTVLLRFGLKDGIVWTLNEVGEKIGLSNERVRQIELKALAKLRTIQRSQKLAPWKESAEIGIE